MWDGGRVPSPIYNFQWRRRAEFHGWLQEINLPPPSSLPQLQIFPSQVPQLTWMSVGRTNALRAGNLTSEASSTEKMDCTPPHDTHHWLLHHVYKPWTLSQLAQVISGRSCSTFRCASSLSTFLEHLFQQDFFQFKVVFAARDGFIFVKPFSNWISHNLHLYLRQWILPCFHTVF